MKNVLTKTGTLNAPSALKTVLGSRYLPFVTAAILLVCNYLALDIVMIYYMVLVMLAIVLLLDDLTPMIGQLMFFNVLSSEENSPSALLNKSDFLARPVIYIQIIVLASILVCAFIYRFVVLVRGRTFKPTPVFWGLCAFSGLLLLNGLGAADYDIMNFAYALVLAFAFLALYVLLAGNVRLTERNFRQICWAFVAFTVLLVFQMVVKYATNMGKIMENINRGEIYNTLKSLMEFGWGNWNTIGMLLTISIPPIFLLAVKYKHGWLLNLYGAFITLAALFTCSRQAMVAAIIFYLISAAIVMVKGKRRVLHIASVCAVLLIVAVILAAKREWIADVFRTAIKNLFDDEGQFTANERTTLLKAAVRYFIQNPVFGAGFFVDFESFGAADMANFGFVPLMAHNTFAELLGVSGMLGFTAYCVHRVQTIIAFVKNPSLNKSFFALSIAAMLFMSLVDNHIFYILPTMIYTSLLVFICKDERCDLAANVKELPKPSD